MELSDADIEKYARQIIVPGVGAAGQLALRDARLVLVGDSAALPWLALYAQAAGISLSTLKEQGATCAIAANPQFLPPETMARVRELRCPIVWYAFAAARLRAGLVRPGDSPSFPAEAPTPDDALLQPLAAADAVATAIGVILGWTNFDPAVEVDFA